MFFAVAPNVPEEEPAVDNGPLYTFIDNTRTGSFDTGGFGSF